MGAMTLYYILLALVAICCVAWIAAVAWGMSDKAPDVAPTEPEAALNLPEWCERIRQRVKR